ncbi:MAG: alkaline phosphatase family protein [Bacteroidetes bacterium]|nr:alkaline phosphatase family protein [Bacteroidota bacterium]
MKPVIVVLFCLLGVRSVAQSAAPRNVFIITTDGFRWQEVFRGADSLLIRDTACVKDTTLLCQQFWSDDPEERKRKLLPFFWNVIAQKGRLSGNRSYGSEVNVANLYKISYPGYNEILTGYADTRFIPNLTVRNRNTNILEYLNTTEIYAGKVVAFSSWNLMPYILAENRSGLPVNSGYEMLEEGDDTLNILINEVQKNVVHKGNTRQDLLTYASAKNYIEQQHPKVVFLGLGETDEYAHKGHYDQYLQKAHQVDRMLAELWYYVQTDPFYKDNTVFLITTDHGRGSKRNKWRQHGFWVKGSGEAWMAMIGAGIASEGEIKTEERLYQKQIASTVSLLLNEKFEAPDHTVAEPLKLITNAVAAGQQHSKTVSVNK